MEKIYYYGLLFIAITFIGFYFAYLYGHKTKNFRWSEYFAIIIWPILSIIAFAFVVDARILNLFLISAFFGFLLEYIVGLAYHKTLNKRLWVYQRLSLNGYTSLLSIPLWGIAGVLFWFLSKVVGL